MKTILLFSGGLDSTVALYLLRSQGHDVVPLSVTYGQRHGGRELLAAEAVLRHASLLDCWRSIHVGGLLPAPGACLTDRAAAVPQGVAFDDPAGQAPTVVPGRNLMLLSLAHMEAHACGADAVALACHGGDWAAYPDCREYFVRRTQEAMAAGGGRVVSLLTPLMALDKRAVVSEARRLGVPVDLTWSCYVGGDKPCLCCGACLERQQAEAAA